MWHEHDIGPAPLLPDDLTATPFFGREDLLDQLEALLVRDDQRLITLTGPGGIGKSRLARELLRRLEGRASARLTWAQLTLLRDADLFGSLVADALGVVRDASSSAALELVISRFQEIPCILVLDNAEHILALRPQIERLIEETRALAVICTSRVALSLPGELVVVVPPLDVPQQGGNGSTGNMSSSSLPAVRIFEERARRSVPGFRVSGTNAGEVAALCSRLGGLPLAIELAASRSALYSPADLLRLDSRLVPAISADAGERQSLLSTVQWAFERLSPAASEAAQRLALFVAGFTLESARLLCHVEPMIVSELIDHHLVRVTEDAAGQRRFTMHELIRQHAVDLLERTGATSQAQEAFVSTMASLAAEFMEYVWDATFPDHLTRYLIELPHMRLAMEWARSHAMADAAGTIAAAAEIVMRHRGTRDDLSSWVAAIERCCSNCDVAGTIGACALLHRVAAQLLVVASEPARATAHAERALQWGRQCEGDVTLLGSVILTRSWMAIQEREFSTAAPLLEEARALIPARNDPFFAFEVHQQLGVHALFREDLELAERSLFAALDQARALGLMVQLAGILHYLGYLMMFMREFNRGRTYLDEAAALIDTRSARLVSLTLQPRGRLEIRAADPVAAAPWVARVLRLRFENGDTPLLQTALIDAACVVHLAGDPVLAARILGAARAETERAKPRTLFNGPGQDAWDDARERLGDPAFRNHYVAGAAAPMADTIDVSLERLDAIALGQAPVPAVSDDTLTVREREVLALMAEGYSNREIGECLFIGTETVKTHIKNVLRKLDVSTRSAAVAVATRNGLVSPPPAARPGTPHHGSRSGRASAPGGARDG